MRAGTVAATLAAAALASLAGCAESQSHNVTVRESLDGAEPRLVWEEMADAPDEVSDWLASPHPPNTLWGYHAAGGTVSQPRYVAIKESLAAEWERQVGDPWPDGEAWFEGMPLRHEGRPYQVELSVSVS